MTYDERILSFPRVDRASLLTLDGRVEVPFRFGAYQAARLDRIRGQADLLYRTSTFYLACTVDAPEPPPSEPAEDLGGYALHICIGQSDRAILDWLREEWGDSVTTGSNRTWRWLLHTAAAGRFLSDIAPYLRLTLSRLKPGGARCCAAAYATAPRRL
jgi:hypothetical protein